MNLSGNNSEKWVGTIWEKLDGLLSMYLHFILHYGKLLKFCELEAKALSSLCSQNGVLEKNFHSGIETAHSPSPVEKEFRAHIPESTIELEVDLKYSVGVLNNSPPPDVHLLILQVLNMLPRVEKEDFAGAIKDLEMGIVS